MDELPIVTQADIAAIEANLEYLQNHEYNPFEPDNQSQAFFVVCELSKQLAPLLAKATRKRTMASGVLIQMHYLGGAKVCDPFVLRDGLSDETIAAICADLAYTYDLGVIFKPSGVKVDVNLSNQGEVS